MKRHSLPWMIALIAGLALQLATSAALADTSDRDCSDLIRKAQSLRQDLKTVNIVLGSAIDAGGLDRIKSYKLKKRALNKELQSVMKSIRTNECVLDR
jgi:hypothetical protein